MRFHLIDRIEAVELGKSLCAIKNLTLAEEYLADHFPSFPVMPGVLQLTSAGRGRFMVVAGERAICS